LAASGGFKKTSSNEAARRQEKVPKSKKLSRTIAVLFI
jgi:hypothetical protein